MKDGTYTFYAIKFRTTLVSKTWGEPKSKLVPYKEAKPHLSEPTWGGCGTDYWGAGMDPHNRSTRNFRHLDPKAHEDLYYVKNHTGRHGWRKLKYAIKALKRIRKLDKEGHFDSRGPYGEHMQRVRREFKIIKVEMSQKTIEVTVDEIVESL